MTASNLSMSPEPHLRSTADPLAPQVPLVQKFLTERQISFGSPWDLFSFARQVSTPGKLQDDTTALLREVLVRENLQPSPADLLDLICKSVGGAYADLDSPDFYEPVSQLLVFANVVLLPFKKRSGDRAAKEGMGTSFASAHLMEAPDPGEAALSAAIANSSLGTAPGHQPRNANDPRLTSTHAETRFTANPNANLSLESSETAERRVQPETLAAAGFMNEAATASSVPLRPTEFEAMDLEAPSPGAWKRSRWLSRPAALTASVALAVLAFGIFWPIARHPAGMDAPLATAQQLTGSASTAAAPEQVPVQSQGEEVMPASPQLGSQGSEAKSLSASARDAGRSLEGQARNGSGLDGTLPLETSDGASPSRAAKSPEPGGRAPSTILPAGHGSHGQPPSTAQHHGRRGLITVSSGVMNANLLSAPPPEYPALARIIHVQGQVILQAVVARDGKVIATHVIQGHHLLRGAAEHAVRSWRYRPYTINDRPTDVETIVFVDFRLRH